MKLQKQTAYQYKGKKTHKFVLVVPEKIVKELGWKSGMELQAKKSVESSLIIFPPTKKSPGDKVKSNG